MTSEWHERLRRFVVCDVIVVRFCARERVTEPAFWYWRRQYADIPTSPESSTRAFAPVDIMGGRSVSLRFPAGAVLEIPDDRGLTVLSIPGHLPEAAASEVADA
jgi:hypothetical protein